MKQIAFLLIAFSFGSFAMAQNDPSWLRYPSISPDGKTIVFTYKGDLYKISASGGTAVSLTQHEAHDFMPIWSPDGRTVVFASDRYGNFDLFSMSLSGGEVRRLTHHSAQEYPYRISPDGKWVYFGGARMDAAANRQFPTGSQPELYKVPLEGGSVQQVFTTPAEEISFSADGKTMLYQDKKGGENAWRKHHVSSIARDIWMFNPATNAHTRLTSFAGEDRDPVFAPGDQSFYYLSETGGSFNVYKASLTNPSSPVAVTNFKKHPVRFLSAASNGTLCFGYDGSIYTQQEGGQPAKLQVSISTEDKGNNQKILGVSGGAGDLAVSPNGKEVAFVYRGEVFVTSVEGGTTRRITNTPEQERNVSFAPDGRSLLYSSERGGNWKIFQCSIARKEEPYFFASTVLKEQAIIENEHENYQPEFSPDGKEIAFVEDRMTLKVYNLATKSVRTLLTTNELFSMRDNDQYFTWSPDSKWLLFEFSEPGFWNGEVGIISADGKNKKINLTESGFQDYAPQWAAGGKMLIWQSTREGMRAAAASGPVQGDVYAMFLSQDAYDKYNLSKEDFALWKEADEKNKKADTSKAKKTAKDSAVVIDWDGLKYRKARLTLHSSSLGDALVSQDGETLYYLARFEKGYNLWSTNLRTKEIKMLAPLNAASASMAWDKDQKNIFLLSGGRITKLDPASGKQENVGINGEMMLNTAAERAFMFDHVWRRTQKTFYTAGYHGAKWQELKNDYQRYLPHMSNNYEFSEMLSELLGELNVSHSGSSYVASPQNADATASIGIFYDESFQGPGWKIEEIITEGPLNKPYLKLAAGMIIESIDGEPIRADIDRAFYLNRKAGRNTLLTILNPANGNRHEITIKPVSLGEESRLLYKRWVRRNADEVDRLSNGQLGYVHIPGMNDNSYRTVYEEAMGKYANRKAMVVDTRNNGGGDLVADLAMFLSGKKFFDYTTDTHKAGYEPNFRWTKPSIALANEDNYSDGHCFAFSYQDLKLGKLVGMPVPGTCTFAGWESLQDNSVRWGVPPLGVKDVGGRYLENLQTEPDIKVMNEYEKVGRGKDQQLEAAIAALLKEIQ